MFHLKIARARLLFFSLSPRFYMVKDGYVSKDFFSPQLWLSYYGLLFLHIIWNFTLLMSSANFSVMRDDVQTSMHFSFFSPSLSLTLTPITVPSIKFKFSGKATKIWLNLLLSFDCWSSVKKIFKKHIWILRILSYQKETYLI